MLCRCALKRPDARACGTLSGSTRGDRILRATTGVPLALMITSAIQTCAVLPTAFVVSVRTEGPDRSGRSEAPHGMSDMLAGLAQVESRGFRRVG